MVSMLKTSEPNVPVISPTGGIASSVPGGMDATAAIASSLILLIISISLNNISCFIRIPSG